MNSRVLALGVAVVVSAGLSLLLNIATPGAVYRDDMPGGPYRYEGMFDPPGNSYGYFDEEKAPTGESYRWTTAHAVTTFPYAANAGRQAEISIRMAAFQATEQTPITVELKLNGKSYSGYPLGTHLAVGGPFKVYTARLDTLKTRDPYLDPAHVQIDLLSATRSTPQDARELGVAVDWIEVRMVKSNTEIVVEAATWALVLALVSAVGFARLGVRWGAIFAGGALLSFVLIHLTYMPRSIGVTVEVALAGVAWLVSALLAPRRRPLLGLGLTSCLLWMVVAGRVLGEWQMDDAFISYRYAWNLVHGNGLVYNPSEAVEGYTNFLWTAISAGAMQLGWDPSAVAQVLNIFVSIALIGLAHFASARLSRIAPERNPWPSIVAALLAVDVSLVFYGPKGSGMESASFALMLMLSVVLLYGWPEAIGSRQTLLRVGAGLALATSSLFRPEGLFVAAILLAVRAWVDRRQLRHRWLLAGFPLGTAAAVPFLAVVLPYQWWRISFYGYPFPNTFYAKTGLSPALLERGAQYTFDFAVAHWLIAVPALLGGVVWIVVWLRGLRHRQAGGVARLSPDGLLAALFLLTAVYTLYIIAVGGDHFPAARFFVPLLAPLALLAQEAFRGGLKLLRGNTGVMYAAATSLALAVVLYAGISLWMQTANGPLGERAKRETTAWERWGSAGLWMREDTPPDTVSAAFAAGAISYFSNRYVVDMLGLSDVHIAHIDVANMGSFVAGHEKQDPVYVLSHRPDYILATWEQYFDPVAGEIKANYSYETVDSPTGTPVKWLRRNDTKGP